MYDAIVLGVGGIGSAALYALARRGLLVAGVDRHVPPHDLGSSHGETRIIRQAYFEHPDYVPLVHETFELWRELENAVEEQLLVETGLLEVGPPDGIVVPGVLRAAQSHQLAVEQLSPAEIMARWPAFRVPDDLVGVFESAAGYLHVERCVAAHLQAAEQAGAQLHLGVGATEWTLDETSVRVTTPTGDLEAKRLVLATGAWAAPWLGSLGVPLEIRRKSLFWLAGGEGLAGIPCYLFEMPEGVFYGFPSLDNQRVKAANHAGGQVVSAPESIERGINPSEQAQIETFASTCIPSSGRVLDHSVCFYTMSPDDHFVVDVHPDDPRVVFAAGLSGHGFKFAPVLGETLADLAVDGVTQRPIDFLGLRRFAA